MTPSKRTPVRMDLFVKAVAFDFGHTLVREDMVDEKIQLMPGVRRTLPLVSLPMAVWANTKSADHQSVRRMLNAAGIDQYISSVATSIDAGFRKPAPQFFKYALAIWNFRKEEVLFVCNQLNTDVLGAEGYGIASAWLSGTEFRSKDETMTPEQIKPLFTLSAFTELPALLKGIAIRAENNVRR